MPLCYLSLRPAGDVTQEKWGATHRWVSDHQVSRCIDQALAAMGGGNPGSVHVHIFSEGKESDFSPALRKVRLQTVVVEPTFHLNTELLSTFHHMCAGSAPSSLSSSSSR